MLLIIAPGLAQRKILVGKERPMLILKMTDSD